MQTFRFGLLSLLLFCTSALFAQDKILIEPGRGVGKLVIGMKLSKVKKLLGAPLEKKDVTVERDAFVKAGYEPNDFLVFKSGFDECWEYGNNKEDYPVFKIYLKKRRVCYVVLGDVPFGSVRAGIFVMADGLGFNSK